MSALFRTARRVEFADTDMAGIAHFSRFFVWMESAEHELLRSLGLSVHMNWENRKISFPRVGASCDFLQPVRFEEMVTISVSVENVGRSSITFGFKFFKGEQAVARGQMTTVCCTMGPGGTIEAIEIPSAIRQRLEQPVAET